jgi:dethiobiotin synthetase
MTRYFVTGIGTGVGKSVMSALLCEALEADYWKPVQAGELEFTDTDFVRSLVSSNSRIFHPEAYRLPYPLSPHASAERAGIEIDPKSIRSPETSNKLIIEGAGGLMVPLNRNTLYIDLLSEMNTEVILVSQHYLGSINHTLLSAESLMLRNIPVKGIIFNGDENQETESILLEMTGFTCLGRIPLAPKIDRAFIQLHAPTFASL